MQPYELTDGVVLLAAPTHADAAAIAAACQDPDIQRWTTIPSPYALADAEGFVRDVVGPGWTTGHNLVWSVRRPADRSVVGSVGVDGVEPGGRGGVGFWMVPAARGQGLLTRALRLVVDDAFDRHGLDHLTWDALVGNWASRRVAWKVGFQVEAVRRHHVRRGGSWRDAWGATLLHDDPREPTGPWDGPVLSGRRPPAPG